MHTKTIFRDETWPTTKAGTRWQAHLALQSALSTWATRASFPDFFVPLPSFVCFLIAYGSMDRFMLLTTMAEAKALSPAGTILSKL